MLQATIGESRCGTGIDVTRMWYNQGFRNGFGINRLGIQQLADMMLQSTGIRIVKMTGNRRSPRAHDLLPGIRNYPIITQRAAVI